MQYAIDDLVKDFDQKKLDHDLVEIKAPEMPSIGGVIYCPQYAAAQRKGHCLNAREKEGLMAFAVTVLINFALDSDGKNLFKPGHKDTLMKKVDDKVLERLSQEICQVLWGDDEDDFEVVSEHVEAKKPYQETRTSSPVSS